jgi:hypothetical protein
VLCLTQIQEGPIHFEPVAFLFEGLGVPQASQRERRGFAAVRPTGRIDGPFNPIRLGDRNKVLTNAFGFVDLFRMASGGAGRDQ